MENAYDFSKGMSVKRTFLKNQANGPLGVNSVNLFMQKVIHYFSTL